MKTFAISTCLRPRALASALVAAALVPADGALALDWRNDYSLRLSTGYDDNFRLSESDEIETSVNTLGVAASLDGRTEISSIGITAAASGTSYSDSDVDDSDDANLSLDAERRGERTSAAVVVSFATASTTETELLDTGVIEDGSRDTLRVAPSVVYRLSERDSASLGLSYSDVSYDEVSLVEYNESSISLGWKRELDATSAVTATIRTAVYDPETGRDTDIDSLGFGYERALSTRANYAVSLGYSEVDNDQTKEDSADYAFEFGYRLGERDSLAIAFSNDYRSSGSGSVREEDRLSVDWSHSLGERTGTLVSAQGIRTDDREFLSLNLAAYHQASPDLRLSAGLRLREREEPSIEADSSFISLTLVYSPQ